jgi:(2Fe-2S) ferredoxin
LALSLIVCVNHRATKSSCAGNGSIELIAEIEKALSEHHLDIPVERGVCFGRCNTGPNLRIAPGGAFYTQFSPGDISRLIDELKAILSTCDTSSEG